MLIEIGLTEAKEGHKVGDTDAVEYVAVEGLRVLAIHTPDDLTTGEAFRTITDPGGVYSHHSDAPPAWVVCEDKPALASLLAEHFACAEGKPVDLEATHWTVNGPPGVDNSVAAAEVPA